MAKVHLVLFHVINVALKDKVLVLVTNHGPTTQLRKIILVPVINLVTIVVHGTGGTAMTVTIVMTVTIDEMTIDEVIETAETDAEPSVIRMRARLRALL